MTRYRTLLLAGTILPALTLAPLSGVFAQSPDEGPGQRPHREGGPRGGGEGGPGPRQGGGERAQGRAPAERAQGERAQGERAQSEGARGERGGAGGGAERRRAREDAQGAPAAGGETKRARTQNADTERPNRGAATTAEEPKAGRKAAETPKAAPAAREAPKAAQAEDKGENRAEKRRERRENRENARDNTDATPKGAARDNADRGATERDGAARRGQNADRDPDRARGNRDRAEDNNRGPDRNDRNQRAGDRDDRRDTNRERAGGRDPDDRNLRAGERGRDNDRRDNDRRFGNDDRRDDRRGGPSVTIGIGGGFLPGTQARRLDDLRRDRREVREGDRVFIREPGRTIVQQGGRAFIVHDETERYRALGLNTRRERRGGDFVDITTRPGGEQILTFTDESGRMLRRVRRGRDGREFVLIDNGVRGRVGAYDDDVVALPPPPLRIPRNRYIVDYRDANAGTLYETLSAPPLAAPPRRYTLDQVRYSPDVRNYVRSVDINTINFDSGSWDVPAEATRKLEALADAINKSVDRNPNSVFLIEGYTDATGNPNDNLSLSDRRAQSVAEILTKDFKVPPENLTTQGYGQQNPKEDTSGPSAANRRVVVRNITQLLASGDEPTSGQ